MNLYRTEFILSFFKCCSFRNYRAILYINMMRWDGKYNNVNYLPISFIFRSILFRSRFYMFDFVTIFLKYKKRVRRNRRNNLLLDTITRKIYEEKKLIAEEGCNFSEYTIIFFYKLITVSLKLKPKRQLSYDDYIAEIITSLRSYFRPIR